jgi:DNA-3-methyladenine glycosylase
LGKYLVRHNEAGKVAGRIIDVEAYVGPHDKACHASKGRTQRTDVMFGPGGVAYVYLIYGMYHCFNIVTEKDGYPAAVLVRAVELDCELIDGPGRVCRRLNIDRSLNHLDLTRGEKLWLEDRGGTVRKASIGRYPRIGVDYAGEWATKLWRFRLELPERPTSLKRSRGMKR